MIIGYARVSTTGQTRAAQIQTLQNVGCTTLFQETAPGHRTHRVQLENALDALGPGDTLIVTRLDRLARSSRDLHNIVARIEAQGASLKSLAEQWADTSTPQGRLILTVLGGLAEFERSLILERTAEGRARAVAAGRRMGRKPLITGAQHQEALRLAADNRTHLEISRILRVSRSTVSRFLARNPQD